jgi:hypothetical protein
MPDKKPLSRELINLVDVLFGIGMGINFKSLMERPWFSDITKLYNYHFEILVISLVYCWALGSWWGYHVSVSDKPIAGKRFFVDIITMFVYFIIFVSYQSITAIVFLFSLSFAIFFVWDILKSQERAQEWAQTEAKKRAQESRPVYGSKRDIATLWWAIYFVICELIMILAPKGVWLNWTLLLLSYIGTVGYRIHKWALSKTK